MQGTDQEKSQVLPPSSTESQQITVDEFLSFARMIALYPRDDTPRLIFADRLEEVTDNPFYQRYGQFIRKHIQLWNLGASGYTPSVKRGEPPLSMLQNECDVLFPIEDRELVLDLLVPEGFTGLISTTLNRSFHKSLFIRSESWMVGFECAFVRGFPEILWNMTDGLWLEIRDKLTEILPLTYVKFGSAVPQHERQEFKDHNPEIKFVFG